MTTTDLARAYHPDPSRFAVDFAAFREQAAYGTQSTRREGVRLILLCSEVAAEAGDTLSFLRGPGRHVDVLQVGVVRGEDERRLLDVSPLATHEGARRSVEPTALRLVRASEGFAGPTSPAPRKPSSGELRSVTPPPPRRRTSPSRRRSSAAREPADERSTSRPRDGASPPRRPRRPGSTSRSASRAAGRAQGRDDPLDARGADDPDAGRRAARGPGADAAARPDARRPPRRAACRPGSVGLLERRSTARARSCPRTAAPTRTRRPTTRSRARSSEPRRPTTAEATAGRRAGLGRAGASSAPDAAAAPRPPGHALRTAPGRALRRPGAVQRQPASRSRCPSSRRWPRAAARSPRWSGSARAAVSGSRRCFAPTV